MARQRKPGDCCGNCELRGDGGFCVDVLEPLRRDYGLRGVGAIYMPDSAYCDQHWRSDEERPAEAPVSPEECTRETVGAGGAS